MSKYKLTFKLKQHTPLIHFQHDQYGATLRASELKPKLDRFLHHKLQESEKAYKHLLIGKGDVIAFDYKVRIMVREAPNIFDIEEQYTDKQGRKKTRQFPAFFANMGGDTTKKKFSFCENSTAEFFSFNKEMLIIIEENIAEFFATTNFGTRQSKGFGSFYLEPSSIGYKPISSFYKYRFIVEPNSKVNEHGYFKELFNTIDLFYRAMRSGINLKGPRRKTLFYFKSLMFMYAKEKGIQWDKKSIKEWYFNRELVDHQYDHEDSDILQYESKKKHLMRDLFGLSSDEMWYSYRKAQISKSAKSNNNIERFKSPILFKPIQSEDGIGKFEVFLCAAKIDNEYLNETFTIKKNGYGNLTLSTPEVFDFNDFFESFFDWDNFDIEQHVDEDYRNRREYDILYNVFYDINEYK